MPTSFKLSFLRRKSINKLESPSLRDALCQLWVKVYQWICRRRYEKFTDGRKDRQTGAVKNDKKSLIYLSI